MPSLQICTRSADSQNNRQASEVISMANMPLVSHTAMTAIITGSGLSLHTAQAGMPSGSVPQARKSLNFDNATAPPVETATAPPVVAPPEQIIVHDMVVQTATEQKTPAQLSAVGAAGTSLQTRLFVKHPNTVKRRE